MVAFSDDGKGVQAPEKMKQAMRRAKALGKALAGFTLGHRDDAGVLALVGHPLGVLGGHAAVGDHGHPAVQPGKLVQVFQRAALDIFAVLKLGMQNLKHSQFGI